MAILRAAMEVAAALVVVVMIMAVVVQLAVQVVAVVEDAVRAQRVLWPSFYCRSLL